MDLKVRLLGSELANPTILASGLMGMTSLSLATVAKAGAGAVTTKSIGPQLKVGHPNPTILEFEGGIANAVGLSNTGADDSVEKIKETIHITKAPVIVSFFADTPSNFADVAAKLSQAEPPILEANISCPNVESEMGTPFSYSPDTAAQVVRAIKEVTKIPLIVKLSPATFLLKKVAKAVEDAGAEAINMGNTHGPGMFINIEAKKPVLANKAGGISGPAIRPMAVRCVWDVYETVKIPIIGTGGIITGRDAIEMMMAGAMSFGLGSAIKYRGLKCFKIITKEMTDWMEINGYSKPSELVGVAHE